MGEVGGETTLHVAAAIPDGGRMSKLVRERCPLAKGMWNSRRNSQGRAPADIAYLSVPLLRLTSQPPSTTQSNSEQSDVALPGLPESSWGCVLPHLPPPLSPKLLFVLFCILICR